MAPLVFLAFLAIVAGWWNVTGGFTEFMGEHAHTEATGFFQGLFGVLTHPLPLISLFVGLSGISLAYAIYKAKWISAEKIRSMFRPIHSLLEQKYFFDELYEGVIVRNVLYRGLFNLFQLFDTNVVDGTVNAVADGTRTGGEAVRKTQTGQLQLYGLFIGGGAVIITIVVFLFG